MSDSLGIQLSRLKVWVDGSAIDPVELAGTCRRLTVDLAAFAGRRVALIGSRPDQVLVAVAAAEAADCELLLVRQPTPSPASIAAWKVAALIDPALEVTPTDLPVEPEFGFHLLIPTSGTTGEPKLARHTIERLLGRIRRPDGAKQPPRWLLTYHPATFGGLQLLLTALASGGELIAATHPDPAQLADQALRFPPTHVSGTPTFWRSFLSVLGARAQTLAPRQITLGGEIAD